MWQVVGQPRALALLHQSLKQGNLAHAYLLVGPPGVGKKTAALNLAQAVNCQGTEPPCQECPACLRTARGQHTDVYWIRKEKTEVSIDQVREVARLASLKAVEGGWRVFIVEAELSLEAANAFLKTLEEPPPGVLFSLVANRERNLPATLRSRCQRLEFYPLAPQSVEEALVARGASPEGAQRLAGLAAGSLGWALAAWQNGEIARQRQDLLDDWHRLCHEGLEERFAWAARQAEAFRRDREALWETLEVGLHWARDLLLVKGRCFSLTFLSEVARLKALTQKLELGDILAFLQSLEATRLALEQNANARLALEVLTLSMPQASHREAQPALPTVPDREYLGTRKIR